MRTRNDSVDLTIRRSLWGLVKPAILPCAMGLSFLAACSSDGSSSNSTLAKQSKAGVGLGAHTAAAAGNATDAGTGLCSNPLLGSPDQFGSTGPTESYVSMCETTHACTGDLFTSFSDSSQVALDYGDFPSSFETNGLVDGSYFYAVIEPGYENGGFLDGAPGNLSDTTASSAPGDHGGGDSVANRTIVGDGQFPGRFPRSSGTHAISFPPAQFIAIQLIPFDLTPNGQYELVVCPSTATARCDCAFGRFFVQPHDADAGNPAGAGGSTATGGSSGTAGTAAAGAAGSTACGGAGGDAAGSGGMTTGSGGSGGESSDAGCGGAGGGGGAGGAGPGGASTTGSSGASSAGAAGAPCLVDGGTGGASHADSGGASGAR